MPENSLGSDTKQVRVINRTVILNLIREEGPITKSQVARQTGISVSTVNRIVDELLKEELIRETSTHPESASGRPGEWYEFDGKNHFVIGVDLGFPNLRGMISDLNGDVKKEVTVPAVRGNGNENYQGLLSLLEILRADTQDNISGIGLGVSGVVDPINGVVWQSPIMGWENFALVKQLNKETGLTPFLDNDINLITFGEYGFGVGRGVANLACFTLGTQVGCGLILNGEIHRGAGFNSGSMDYAIPGVEALKVAQEAEGGSLYSLVSSPSVLDRGRKALQAADPARAARLSDPKDVYRAAREGEAWASPIIEQIVPYLAITVANISMLLDLEMVVFSGRMSEEARQLVPLVSCALTGKVPRIPRLQASNLGTRSTVLGAIMLVYRGILRNW